MKETVKFTCSNVSLACVSLKSGAGQEGRWKADKQRLLCAEISRGFRGD